MMMQSVDGLVACDMVDKIGCDGCYDTLAAIDRQGQMLLACIRKFTIFVISKFCFGF